MAFRKVAKLIEELKLFQYNVYNEKDKRIKRAFAIIGFNLEEDIRNFLIFQNGDTRFVSSIRLFKKSSDIKALLILNMDEIIPKLIALKLTDSEFHFEYNEESFFIGLLVERSIVNIASINKTP